MRRALTLLSAVLVAALVTPYASARDEKWSLVFDGVTVLDGVGGVKEDASVAIRDGLIRTGISGGPNAVRFEGAYLSPGLIEPASRAGYLHAEAEVTRELTAASDARDLVDTGASVFREAALEGCTTVVVVPGPRNVVGGLSCAFRSWTPEGRATVIDDAARSLSASIGRSPSTGNFPPRFGPTSSIYARRPTTRMGVVWLLRQTFLAAKGEQEKTNDASLAAYTDVLEGRRRLRVHCNRAQDIKATLRLADEVSIDVTLDGAEEAYLMIEELAKRKVPIISGPLPAERTGVGPDNTDSALRNTTILHEAGLPVTLTSGSQGARWLREQAMYAMRYGVPREKALAMVTSVAADMCGLRGRGRIRDGAVADLVLWSGHPLSPTSRALMVVIDGRVVFDHTKTLGGKKDK